MPARIELLFRQLIAKYQESIVSKWSRLEQLDPSSREYLRLLTSLLDDAGDRRATTALKDEDATIVLDILARVLDHGENLGKLSNRTLGVLRTLAYNACKVPNHYKIDRSMTFDVDTVIFASGGFSDVRKGRLGGQLVAVKVLRMALNSNVPDMQKHFCKETILWKNISHPNILGLIAVEIDSTTGKCSMVSELMTNGNIVDFIRSNSVNRLQLLADAAKGLQYLHDHKIVHGDIKGPNILITNGTPPQACLSDFGFSTLTPTTSFAITTHGIDPAGGTRLYMAPELTYPSKFGLPYSQLSKEGDIYALGMVVYEIVMGIRPFGVEGFRVEEVMYVVLDGARPARPGDPEDVGFGPGVWDLVEACWGEDRTQRPNIRDVHQCLAAAADLSPLVPPGPMIVVSPTREISTGSIPPTSQIHLFESGHEDENGGNDREPTGSILERSMSVARQVVDSLQASIPPTVRDKFGMFDRRYLRDFVDTFRARFNFGSLRTPRPRRN